MTVFAAGGEAQTTLSGAATDFEIVNHRGTSEPTLRGEPEFTLSFADVCGLQAFSASIGGINEIVHGFVSSDRSARR